MSIDDKKETEVESRIIEVTRTEAEKELQQRTEELAAEKQKLQDQLTTALKRAEDLESERDTKVDEYNTIVTERDEVVGKLQTIAEKTFESEKAIRVKTMTDNRVPQEKIDEILEKVKSPADLDQWDYTISLLSDTYKVMQERDAEAEKTRLAAEEEAKGTGTPPTSSTPATPPKASVVSLPDGGSDKYKFENARIGVDTLYERAAAGDKEAERKLGQLWELVGPTIRNKRIAFGVSQCPMCKGGIQQNEVCPYCGFDPTSHISKGVEFWPAILSGV